MVSTGPMIHAMSQRLRKSSNRHAYMVKLASIAACISDVCLFVCLRSAPAEDTKTYTTAEKPHNASSVTALYT